MRNLRISSDAAVKLPAEYGPPETREVDVFKEAGVPLGLQLDDRRSRIRIKKVVHSCPLAGVVWPGEVIVGCSVPGVPAPKRTLTTKDVVEMLSQATSAVLTVETPAILTQAVSIPMIRPDVSTKIGITYEKDATTGMVCLSDVGLRSLASQLTGSDRMSTGDLIVGLMIDNEAHEVTDRAELQKLLSTATGRLVFRLVRPPVPCAADENTRPSALENALRSYDE